MAPEPDPVQLRDGREVGIRPIEPEDAEALTEGLEALSSDSRYRRFLTAKGGFSGRELEYLTDVDHQDHEALVAVEHETGLGLAVARFIKDPNDPRTAELGIVVRDEWQGCGLGSLLLDRLAVRAVEEGVGHFTATVLESNPAIVELLRGVGPVERRHVDGGVAELCVGLSPEEPCPPVLREVLKAAATGRLPLV